MCICRNYVVRLTLCELVKVRWFKMLSNIKKYRKLLFYEIYYLPKIVVIMLFVLNNIFGLCVSSSSSEPTFVLLMLSVISYDSSMMLLVLIWFLDIKCKCISLITTTRYTRNDIIISRAVSTLCVALFPLLLGYVSFGISNANFMCWSLVDVSCVIFCICLQVACGLPFTFRFFSNVNSIFILVLIQCLVILIQMCGGLKFLSNVPFASIIYLFLSIFAIVVSILISIKIYKKRDL